MNKDEFLCMILGHKWSKTLPLMIRDSKTFTILDEITIYDMFWLPRPGVKRCERCKILAIDIAGYLGEPY